MSEMTCNCGKPTRDDAYVCDECLSDLARRLGEMPWVVEQLDITLTKARGVDYSANSGRGNNIPLAHKDVDDDGDAQADQATMLVYHHGASKAMGKLRHEIVQMIRFCDEENVRHQSPHAGYPADTLEAMSAWLLWRVDGLAFVDMAGEFITSVIAAIGSAKRVIDRPADREYSGPCECGRDLYVKPGSKIAKCASCEAEYDVADMQEWMRTAAAGKLFTAREGTTLLGRLDMATPQGTIDKWQERGRLEVRGHNAEGHRLYSLDDLIALAARALPKAG